MKLRYFFNPKSIAVIGVSKDPNKLGYTLLRNIINHNFPGEIYPVNPAGGEVLGKKIYESIDKISHPPELAVISIPNELVPGEVEKCAKIGVKSAVILSSGFAEMKNKGETFQSKISSTIKKFRIRIIGPNCMGIYNIHSNLNATYFWELPKKAGSISFISQSGAYGGIFFSEVRKRNIGISKFISIGNQIDVSHNDLLEFLGKDANTKIIAMFVEEIKNLKEFIETASKIDKPIIVFKVGRTQVGRTAVSSHTGSLAGDFQISRASFEKANSILTNNTDDFFDALTIFSSYPDFVSTKKSLGIVTISGGPSVSAADACEEMNIEVPELNNKIRQEVRKLIPKFGADRNPVDMTPQMNPDNFVRCVEAIASYKQLSGLLAINVGLDKSQFADAFISAKKRFRKPVIAFLVDDPTIQTKFNDANIPIFNSPERAVKAFSFLCHRKKVKKFLPQKKSVSLKISPRKKFLNEYESKKLLRKYGFKTCVEFVVENIDEALDDAEKIGFPVALKVLDIVHKSDKNGVMLNLKNYADVRRAFKKLKKRFPKNKFLLQEMISGEREVIIGAKRDDSAGEFVIFGLGGIFTEALKDFSISICPVSLEESEQMIDRLRSKEILQKFRNSQPVDIKTLKKYIVTASEIISSYPQIKEFDINPLKINNEGKPIVVDAVFYLR